MKAINDSILFVARAGMEITWRYAWVLFLTYLAGHYYFPLPVAVCTFFTAAVLTQLSAGRNWRSYQKLLLQITGFMTIALLALHQIKYQTLHFFDLEWIRHLFLDGKSISDYFVLILMLYCLWLVWSGGHILVKSSRFYGAVRRHFDKGLGLFFLLLISKAFVEWRTGLSMQGWGIAFLAIAYFVFSLTSISIARNQGNIEKSFLSGRHGVGIILSVTSLVVMLGTGIIFLIYPYLYNMADSFLTLTKAALGPMDTMLIKGLLFLVRPRERSLQPNEDHTTALNSTDMNTDHELAEVDIETVDGWGSVLLSTAAWGLFTVIVLIFLGALVLFLINIFRLLLKRNHVDSVEPLPTDGILKLIQKLFKHSLTIWHGWIFLLKGVDCATAVYTKMLRWGRWSGMNKKHSETPAEYGLRLINDFPGLKAEIELIINAFNSEVYGQTTTDQKTLFSLRSALRQMQHLRYWPSRIKVWFFQ